MVETEITLRGYGFGAMSGDLLGSDLMEYIAPNKVVIKCKHCGQWGAHKCACIKCGAPIE